MTRFLVSLFTRQSLRRSYSYHQMFLSVTPLGTSSIVR